MALKVYSINYTCIDTITCHTAKSDILVLQDMYQTVVIVKANVEKVATEGSGEILHLRGGELCLWR